MLKRRILIFILCAAALTGVLMFSALADNDVAVDKVEFSFNAPGNGWSGAACPDLIYSDDAQFDLEYSNGWDYFIDDGIDYDYFPMGYNDVFVTGETYYVQMSIVPREGYVITENTQIVMHGNSGREAGIKDYRVMQGCGYLVMSYKVGPGITFGPADSYKKVSERAQFTVYVDDPDNVASYQWQYSTNGGKSWSTSAASGNKTASASFTVQAKHDGWMYRCIVTDAFGDTAVSKAAKLTVRKAISVLELHTSEMKVGTFLSNVVLVDDQGHELDDEAIMDLYHCNIKYWMENQYQHRIFQDGFIYTFVASIDVVWGYNQQQEFYSEYYFTDDTAVYVNGARCELQDLEETGVTARRSFEITYPKIDSVEFTFTAPAAGQANNSIAEVFWPENDYYWVDNCEAIWTFLNTDGEDTWYDDDFDTFQNGTTYYFEVAVFLADSIFDDNVSFTAADTAGNPASVEDIVVDDQTAYIRVGYTLAAPLNIVSQPVNYYGPEGSRATATVEATGYGLTYEWYAKDPGSIRFSKSGTAVTKTYSVKLTAARNGRQVYCVVTDAYGNTETTNTVTLKISEALEIVAQPENYYGPAGAKATATVEARGDGLTYAWYMKDPGGSKFNLSGSAVTKTYSVKLTAARNGRQLYCVVSDVHGNSVTTDIISLNISTELAIVSQPVDYYGPAGSKAAATVEAVGDGLTYAWYMKDPGGSKFNLSGSAVTKTYSVNLTAARNGRQLYCVVSDVHGNSVTTDTVSLNICTELTIVSQPVDYYGPAGSKAAATVEAVGDGLTYAWYMKDPGGSKFNLSGSAVTKTYSVNLTAARNGRQLYCVVSDAYGNTETTNIVTLNIHEELEIVTRPVDYYGPVGSKATVTVEAKGDGLTYQWYAKDPGGTKFKPSSTAVTKSYSVTLTAARNGRQVYCVITDVYGNSVTTNTVSLNIR